MQDFTRMPKEEGFAQDGRLDVRRIGQSHENKHIARQQNM